MRKEKFQSLSSAIQALSYLEMMEFADQFEHSVRAFGGPALTVHDYAGLFSELASEIEEDLKREDETANSEQSS